jgi:membrane-bound lytic murein transglycosylase D
MKQQQLLFVTGALCLTLMSFVGNVSGERSSGSRQEGGLFNDTLQSRTKAKADSAILKNGLSEIFDYASSENGVRLNPRALSFVQDYMGKNTTNLIKLRDWGLPYFNMMDNILANYGLPTELKYLAVIESKLKTGAVSWAGAVGPWQFMPETAREYGLNVTRTRDDRRDYFKSTHAAAKYLKSLFNEFGDWLLVIAAYNGGPGNVYNAIKKSKSKNFWDLQYHLPSESRNHVKKFIGTHYIFEGQGGVTTLTKAEASEQMGASALLIRKLTADELIAAKTVTISGKYHSSVIARIILMDIVEFNRYNPYFDKLIAGSDNSYDLKLPTGKMELFTANKYQILNESVQLLLSGDVAANAVTDNSKK